MSRPLLDEENRIAALKELEILDTQSETEFDGWVKLAASICGTPISLITLVDVDRQWFKANKGLEGVQETPREIAFCSHAIRNEGIFEVRDASTDPRFSTNPLVLEDPNIRFYAGATLRLTNGAHVGTLCVIDQQPRKLSKQQRESLHQLSNAVVQAMESRRLTQNLAASEAQFRALCASSPLGVFRSDSDGICTYANERWLAIFNISQAEALGQQWISMIHPDDKEDVFTEWTRAATARFDFDMEFRIQQAEGLELSVRAISRPVMTHDGLISGHVGSVEDVTQRSRVQRVLFEERRRLKSILEGTAAGTWEWNIQSGELHFNHRWAEMLGLSLDTLKPYKIQIWQELYHPDDSGSANQMLDEHLAGNSEIYDYELRLRHQEGHWVWVHLRGRVLTHRADGQPEWMFGTQQDITERKEQEQALRKSECLLAETGLLADVGGWELDLMNGALTWTDQTCRIHGLPAGHQPDLEEAIEYYAPEARPVIRDVIERAIKDGRKWDIELPLLHVSGDSIWVRSVGHAEYTNNKPVRLIGAFQNITDKVLQRQALERAHERINVATESGEIGVWDWNIQNDQLQWTPQMYALYGLAFDTQRLNYEYWAKHLHPEDRTKAEQDVLVAIKGSGRLDTEFRTVWPDGSVHHIRASANITRDSDGTALQMLGVNWDVTPLRTLSNQLADQRELLQVTLQSIGDAVITSDLSGRVTWLNPAAEHMTGWLSTETPGKLIDQVFNIVHEDTRQAAENPVKACLEQRKTVRLASKNVLISRGGSEFGIEDSAAPIRSDGGEILGVVLVFHDVTEQRRLTREMNFRATHDALTGLFNRSEFEITLQSLLNRSLIGKSEHALMYIDLDQFKLVNDACGHSQGDQLLIQISKLLEQNVPASDTVARLGGDEFGIILENCTNVDAQGVAQRICDSMDDFRFEHDNRRFRMGTSIGLVPLDGQWKDIESAMQAADTSCLAAKEAGRNRVHVWFDTDKAIRARREDMQWATRLEEALDEDKFLLYAQRIENRAADFPGIHAEVLLRLRDGKGGLIQPNAFLPAAERFNLATQVDQWVLRNSLQVLSRQSDLAKIEMLCINLSGQSVSDCKFHKEAIRLLKEAGDDICQCVCLEITETAAVTNFADASHFINQVRALGVRVALDDFGAGASSFGYLKTLTVDILKIDGQFIKGVVDDPLDCVAVRCFVDIARVANLRTVGEYVETKNVLDCLDKMGIDYVQGFLIHMPCPIEKLLGGVSKKQTAAEV